MDDEVSCEASRPCNEAEVCCQHGGLCEIKGHSHYDADDHFEAMYEGYMARRAEMGR